MGLCEVGVNLVHPTACGPRAAQDGSECSPTQIVKFLKRYEISFALPFSSWALVSVSVVCVWPKTVLPPVRHREALRVDTPGSQALHPVPQLLSPQGGCDPAAGKAGPCLPPSLLPLPLQEGRGAEGWGAGRGPEAERPHPAAAAVLPADHGRQVRRGRGQVPFHLTQRAAAGRGQQAGDRRGQRGPLFSGS